MRNDVIRLLVYEGPDRGYPYRMTPERLAATAARTRVDRFTKATFCDSDDEFAAAVGDADVVVGWCIPKEIIAAKGSGVRWIQLTGVGVNHLTPLDWLPRGTELISASGAQSPTARDTAAMALLMLNGHMPAIIANQHAKSWQPAFASPIAGKTALIIGVGSMGHAVADGAARLGLRVLGISRNGRARRGVERMATPETLLELLPEADFVVLCPALTGKTAAIMDRAAFAHMKPSAGLINLGRAALIDEAALLEALRERRIAGAVLDGYPIEPLPSNSPLWTAPNLILLPHVASGEPPLFMNNVAAILCDNLRRWRDGKPLKNRISRRHGY